MSVIALRDTEIVDGIANYELQELLSGHVSENTKRSYSSDINHYLASGGRLPANREMLLNYLYKYSKVLNPSTLTRRLKGIRSWHIEQKKYDPTLDLDVIKAIKTLRRKYATPPRKANPIISEHINMIKDCLRKHNSLYDCRNLAIVTVGIALAFRCSELINFQYEHLTFTEEGVEVFIPYSKTDQNNQGETRGIMYTKSDLCAVNCLKQWIERSKITSGPIFRGIHRHGQILDKKLNTATINIVVKQVAIDCDLADANGFSGHSLRRGFVTIGIRKGIALPVLAHHGRWKDIQTMMGYYGENNAFTNNPSSIVLS